MAVGLRTAMISLAIEPNLFRAYIDFGSKVWQFDRLRERTSQENSDEVNSAFVLEQVNFPTDTRICGRSRRSVHSV